MITSGTSYDNSIHSMMSMVYTFFIETFLIHQWHTWNSMSFLIKGCKFFTIICSYFL